MQGKFVLVIAAGDKAVYRNHAIVTERAHGAVAVYMTAWLLEAPQTITVLIPRFCNIGCSSPL